jgi:hypothetical protein
VLGRWTTRRCLTDDAPYLGNAREGVDKHLREQDPQSSGTEKWQAGKRANAYTYHYGTGRGVRWLDHERDILWLCALRHEHDGGYTYAEELQSKDILYPETDPSDGSLAPWGEYPDEDALDWARLIYGALATFDDGADAISHGDTVTYQGRGHLSLSQDSDGIWTLTIRKTLGYQHPENKRDKWLSYDEIHALFDHLAGWPTDRRGIVWDNPPHPRHWLFINVHFIEPLQTAEQWLERVAAKFVAPENVPLLTFEV